MKDDVGKRPLCPFCRSAMQFVRFKADKSGKLRVFSCLACSTRLTAPSIETTGKQTKENITIVAKRALG